MAGGFSRTSTSLPDQCGWSSGYSEFGFVTGIEEIRMSDPKYAYPYPAQGYYQGGPYQGQGGPYQGPPVMAPPQYAAPPPRPQPSFLEGCLAALCCCCLIDECCCDPSIIFVG
ncbi:hypothetical protein TRIUR3_01314 [Triticum urartu]|uniref:Cysteine-rich transmembrane domain-containing protein n=2 Tax=Triticum urartu TaxID=4572 RepID=M7Z152_TRIUA|nr:hypothetical protein TRIUR3_01314 [Triticum urartu]